MWKIGKYNRLVGIFCLAMIVLLFTGCGKQSEKEVDFIEACKSGDLTEVQMLAEEGVNIDTQDNGGNTGLRWACIQRHGDVVRFLLQEGVDVELANRDGQTPLIAAAYADARDIAEMLLSIGADVNGRDKKGKTALTWSIERGNFQVRDILIEYGANE